MFDVSHMTIVDMRGIDATAYLQIGQRRRQAARSQQSPLQRHAQPKRRRDDVIVYNMGGWYHMISNLPPAKKTSNG